MAERSDERRQRVGARRRRTRVIQLIFGVLLVAVGVLSLGGLWIYESARTSNVGQVDFATPLSVPPLLEGDLQDGERVFDLEVQAGSTEILPETDTETWGINGSYLAPTLVAERGEVVRMHVRNGLDSEATTLHWHGMELPAVADGGPHQTIQPGATWSPSWRIDQPAASLWFHPHPHGRTADHVYRGVVGMFIVEDEASQALAIPQEYGVDDIPLIMQDVAFDDDGQLRQREPLFGSLTPLGDHVLVNGTHGGYFDVTTQRLRLRLLNASPARWLEVGFADGRAFDVIATDSGLLRTPERTHRVTLTPGERLEVVVEFHAGETATLRSFGADLGQDFFSTRLSGGHDTFELVQFRAADELRASPPLPTALADWEVPDATEALRTRSFRLSGVSINGRQMEMERIDAVLAPHTWEIWEVEGGGGPHNFHPHLVRFLVLDVNGRPPHGTLRGWQDTIPLRGGERYSLLVPVPGYVDPVHPFMLHCHILVHEDAGMMAQFTVEEGGDAGAP